MLHLLEHYRKRLHTVGLHEYEIMELEIDNTYNNFEVHKATLKCFKCGRELKVDIKEFIPKRTHCICIHSNTCKYCGKSFAPKNRHSKQRTICYECNPYNSINEPAQYKKRLAELEQKYNK